MTEPSKEDNEEHRVFIVNEPNKTPFVAPKTLAVERGDQVLFVVAGEKEEFMVCPETEVFRSINAGEEIHAELGSPPKATVRPDVEPNSVHRYEVYPKTSKSIDPILVVH